MPLIAFGLGEIRAEAKSNERHGAQNSRPRGSPRVIARLRSGALSRLATSDPPTNLARERQCLPLAHALADECRPGRSRELDGRVLAEHRRVARHEDGLEVARAGLEQIAATARLLLEQHFVAAAEQPEIARARYSAHRFHQACESLARHVVRYGQLHR